MKAYRWMLVLVLFSLLPSLVFGQRSHEVPVTINEKKTGIIHFTYSAILSGEGDSGGGTIKVSAPGQVALVFSGFRAEGFSNNESVRAVFDFAEATGLVATGPTYLAYDHDRFVLRLPIEADRIINEIVRLKITAPEGYRTSEFRFLQEVIIRPRAVAEGPAAPGPSLASIRDIPEAASPYLGTTSTDGRKFTNAAPASTASSIPDPEPAAAPGKPEGVEKRIPPREEKKTEAKHQVKTEETALKPEPLMTNAELRMRPIDYEETQAGREYTYRFKHVQDLKISDGGEEGAITIIESVKVGKHRHRVVLVTETVGIHRIEVKDAMKNADLQTLGITIDSRLKGSLAEREETLHFKYLEGGVPPYKLAFYRGDEYVVSLDSVSPEGLSVKKKDLLAHRPEGGIFTVRMVDANNEGEFSFDGAAIDILPGVEENKGVDWFLYLLAGLGLVGLGYILLLNRRHSSKKKNLERVKQEISDHRELAANPSPELESPINDQEYEEVIKQESPPAVTPVADDKSATPEDVANEPLESLPTDAATAAAAQNIPMEEKPNSSNSAGKRMKMRISRRAEVSDRDKLPFQPDVAPEKYYLLDMSTHWGPSMVESVYLGQGAVKKLDAFLRQENVDKIKATTEDRTRLGWERNESVPEIGGMLMGQFQRVGNELSYRVSLEKFVPLEASYQNAVKVEIDPLSLARDLGDAQDENPDLSVVGWFHTHPGHGLFLSRPDLKIHHSHFRKPYHLAMEIDSLSERLDTAIFTYTPSGQMNNTYSLRPDTPWFTWKDIEKHARP